MKIFRVVVRGHFDGLGDGDRRMLLDHAADHDIMRSAFTREGTFTYDTQLVAFNYRYEVRHTDPAPDEHAIGGAAIDRARADLTVRGLMAKHLRVTVTDMASVWS
jgi:hypothetical protein